jgi:hypothetical protein
MSKHFAYAIDKRYLPLLLPFGLRGSKDGVTLTDEGSLLATFGFVKIKTPLANVTEELPLVDSIRCSRIHGRRWPELRDEPQRWGMHPLRGEGVITASPQRPLGAHRDRGRPRRADQGPRGRARRNIQYLLALSRPATWIVLFDIASWRRVKRGGWGN